MSDQEIRFRLAEAVAKTGREAADARATLEALYRFVVEAKT
jgi:hypothetical protein